MVFHPSIRLSPEQIQEIREAQRTLEDSELEERLNENQDELEIEVETDVLAEILAAFQFMYNVLESTGQLEEL